MIFWMGFSHAFFKWGFNIAYVLLALGMMWCCYFFGVPVVKAIYGFCVLALSFNPIPMFLFIGKLLLLFMAIGAVGVVIFRLRLIQKAEVKVSNFLAVFPPVVLLSRVVCAPFIFVRDGWVNCTTFVKMFYEQSCPPIKIISEDEEAIDRVAAGGEL
jgi:hypothetical protein